MDLVRKTGLIRVDREFEENLKNFAKRNQMKLTEASRILNKEMKILKTKGKKIKREDIIF